MDVPVEDTSMFHYLRMLYHYHAEFCSMFVVHLLHLHEMIHTGTKRQSNVDHLLQRDRDVELVIRVTYRCHRPPGRSMLVENRRAKWEQ